MARNAEKAMTTLARWRAAQIQDQGKDKERRPYLASECLDLAKAEKWRMQIIREIAKKVAQIQNAGLGEFRIRDLNDEINKLLREKGHWEAQIREIGGPDYAKIGPRMLDHEGKEVPGNRGYKYFGAAKDLPGVRELFEQEPPPPPRKTRAELMKDIDADYYGYRDDDDGILIPLEQEAERKAMAEAIAVWKAKKEALLQEGAGSEEGNDEEALEEDEENIYAVEPDGESEDDSVDEEGEMDSMDGPCVSQQQHRARFMAHVPVPSQREVEAALLQRRKQELLERYASDDLVRQEGEAKSLLGMSTPKS
ncbi:pre-mRNA-splicing factor ISY1 homolog [Hetaerina americana]|uniref:pre-mRNA-splicing factor ISY1 homolog n=1 Tax=Hetaerina americana TaxID=62018 RepID=UPI003A7F2D6B